MREQREILIFFPHQDKKKWVAWTQREDYFTYAAADSAEDLLRTQQNKSLNTAVDMLPIQESKAPEEVAQALAILQDSPPQAGQKKEEAQESAENRPETRPTAITLLLPVVSSKAAETSDKVARLFVLAIGVNDYQDPIPKLKFAAKDAQDLAAMMKKQEGLFYEDVTVRCLPNKAATRKAIFEQLEWIRKQTTPNDIALIFISGHGTNDPYGYYYFLPVDSHPEHLLTTAVPFSAIQKTAAFLAGKALFFIDTCRAGGAMGDKQVDIRRTLNELAQSNKSIVVFASSSQNQVSLEKDEWNNGVFTKSLLEGISGQATTGQSEITVYSLSLYISKRVKELTGGKQTPTIAIPSSMADFAIAKQSPEK
jgi:hypothetical protein